MNSTNAKEVQISCPKCGLNSRPKVIEKLSVDWLSMLLIGLWAFVFPSKLEKKFECEHCGHQFTSTGYIMTPSDRVIGWVFVGLFILVPVLVFLMTLFWK